ncbi:calcium-translocating P-type ATPase, SERCA-type [Candidatus Woesearchaeota archaeon CG10_big_fil_rev_8_21_14_0_10_45_16]|nr:MAG: calcium-translocating P-type ATPase, SERCA-type [Candidatus Woesearchaeota archaeon CG10_big_fil_rev_8_21_14_0_10_45_16]
MEKREDYHALDIIKVLKDLKTSIDGLSLKETEERLHSSGLNELAREKHVNYLQILLEQFTSPLVLVLLAAIVISLFLHETADAIIITVIVVLNAIIGFRQEYKAEKAIEALQRLASPKARVIRAGKEMRIDSRYLVPGDIILLDTGDKVPADARLLEIFSLQTQEGSLTGESQPVSKTLDVLNTKTALADRINMVYSSTVVTKGRGTAVVTSTGMHSEVGKIATMIQESVREPTPLQKKLKTLGKYLTIAVVAVAVIVFIAGLLGGKPASEMFLTAVALAVAAIPEGLPAVITISLAIGVQRMIKRNALVRKLPSVETLGSVTVICTDKTGTLTHNEMTVRYVWSNGSIFKVTGSGYEASGDFKLGEAKADTKMLQQLLKAGLLCNNAHFTLENGQRQVVGDPTEAALLVSAEKAKLDSKQLMKKEQRTDEIPFSSERKMMSVICGKISYTKGAPDVVLEKCDKVLLKGQVVRLDRDLKKEIMQQNEVFASKALRVLGFAYNDSFTSKESAESNMVFVGLQAMIDPPRKEVKEAIKVCKEAGIRVIMITGDQIMTAKAIAADLGIEGRAVSGLELERIKLEKEIADIGIFARVNPEHKLDIVKALQKKGEIVAMTGDGINDAPALKKADIGISMGITGTDVAKEAADMILTDDNFTSIVNAVEEGRGIFDNIRKFVNYLLSSNLGEITVLLLASLFVLPLPLTAIQILWVNLVTDGLPAVALSRDPHAAGIMKRKPLPPKENIISRQLRWNIISLGVLMGVIVLILFWFYQASGLAKAQTVAFTSLVLFELTRLQIIRSEYKLSLFSNGWLLSAVLGSLLLQLAVIYTPLAAWFGTVKLSLMDWIVMVAANVVLYLLYRVADYVIKKRM